MCGRGEKRGTYDVTLTNLCQWLVCRLTHDCPMIQLRLSLNRAALSNRTMAEKKYVILTAVSIITALSREYMREGRGEGERGRKGREERRERERERGGIKEDHIE